jgi:hypothetical protein
LRALRPTRSTFAGRAKRQREIELQKEREKRGSSWRNFVNLEKSA